MIHHSFQWGLHVVFRARKAQSHKPITDGNCILVEGYIVQFILFYPWGFQAPEYFFYPCPSVPEYVSVEQVENSSTESVDNQLHFNIFVVFIMAPPLDDRGIQFYRPFVKKWSPCNNIKTPQYNYFKSTCLEMLLRTSYTDQVRISLCGVFCIFRFLLWCQTNISWPFISQAGHSFHSYFCHKILVIKAFLL